MIRFYFVFTGGKADAVERPFFDVFEAGYVVPAREFVLFLCRVVATGWDPVATKDSSFVSEDVSGARDCTFGCVLEIGFGWVLF
jgi:hypothetical protein